MKTIGFFNNKGGVGKTSLVYHVAWMLSALQARVIVADLDPQANLTSMFLTEDRLEEIWSLEERPTVYGALSSLFRGVGEIRNFLPEMVNDRIGLIPGDLELSRVEDDLSTAWPDCGDGKERAFRVISSLARSISQAGQSFSADVALVDVGPNLGALNRAALLACSHVIVPVGADLFSLQGLRNMGPTLRTWRAQWGERKGRNPEPTIQLPDGQMTPAGYIVMRHSVLAGRAAKAYSKWIDRMPKQYWKYVLDEHGKEPISIDSDANCLALLKDYRSLMPLAQEARKPMFNLKPADGAFGGHQAAVQGCWTDFKELTLTIMQRCGVSIFG
ncbi:ParA family protein [Roseiterribacter gracilis]|uniref:Phage-related regulatory protein n=1 Tax=Roseiterribacter gracilis TaxID=2812848 RepID=A0A8S8XEB2_9PROT|nr:phage-related regulatory protein [Rhodospirillales bacterium TMPK1]